MTTAVTAVSYHIHCFCNYTAAGALACCRCFQTLRVQPSLKLPV